MAKKKQETTKNARLNLFLWIIIIKFEIKKEKMVYAHDWDESKTKRTYVCVCVCVRSMLNVYSPPVRASPPSHRDLWLKRMLFYSLQIVYYVKRKTNDRLNRFRLFVVSLSKNLNGIYRVAPHRCPLLPEIFNFIDFQFDFTLSNDTNRQNSSTDCIQCGGGNGLWTYGVKDNDDAYETSIESRIRRFHAKQMRLTDSHFDRCAIVCVCVRAWVRVRVRVRIPNPIPVHLCERRTPHRKSCTNVITRMGHTQERSYVMQQ